MINRRAPRTHRVADFSTLSDLVKHARSELGATHTHGQGVDTRIYFPRGDGQYEESTVWQKGNYWHATGPGARQRVSRPPRDARPISAHAGRFAAEASHIQQVSAADAERLPIGSFLWADQRAWVVVPNGIAPISVLAERAGRPAPEGESAASIASEFTVIREGDGRVPTHGTAQRAVIAWVQGQRGHRVRDFAAETSRHTEKSEAELITAGRCPWETATGMPGTSRCGQKARPGHLYCPRHERDWLDLYPQHSLPMAPRGQTVRDYVVIDRHDRTVAGPFKHSSDARDAAGTAGVVKFVPSQRAPQRASENVRRSAHHTPERGPSTRRRTR